MAKKISGTKEWSEHSVNCVTGCVHDCKYCYAREMAVRQKRVTAAEWPNMVVRENNVKQGRKKLNGTVMFPTTHDITPAVLKPCLTVLDKLLRAGNNLLIVSKPHLDCIKQICHVFADFRDEILFRFTIGSANDEILSFWEPGAPPFLERLSSLEFAFASGFKTSVSSEPLLDYDGVEFLGTAILPLITDAWWIGKMNKPDLRVNVTTRLDRARLEAILYGQTDEKVLDLYERYKDDQKVKWKESYKSVVGIELPTEPGTDM